MKSSDPYQNNIVELKNNERTEKTKNDLLTKYDYQNPHFFLLKLILLRGDRIECSLKQQCKKRSNQSNIDQYFDHHTKLFYANNYPVVIGLNFISLYACD